MKVITLDSIQGTEREVACPYGGFISDRFLLADDGLGFSVHRTRIPKGETQHWHYKKHLEACYCIAGSGILTELTTGSRYRIAPDTLYALDKHDDHTFKAESDVILISIFNPPCKGRETHNAEGSYE